MKKRSLKEQKMSKLRKLIREEYNKVISESFDDKRIKDAVHDASQAFWGEVARLFPEIKYGDMDPMEVYEMDDFFEKKIRSWLKNDTK